MKIPKYSPEELDELKDDSPPKPKLSLNVPPEERPRDDDNFQIIDDDVYQPNHYLNCGTVDMETIEGIKGMLPPEEFRGYLRGNIMKYLWRYPKKGLSKDLRKMEIYSNWLYQHELQFPSDKTGQTNQGADTKSWTTKKK